MSSQEDYPAEVSYVRQKTEAAIAEVRAESNEYGGRTSVIAGGIWFASGAFVTEMLLGMSGKVEHMPIKEQIVVAALGGLAAAGAVIRKGYTRTGIHPGQLIQARRERQRGNALDANADYLLSWVGGEDSPRTVDEAEVERFRQEMDETL